ncbi:MAG: murein transglycosylase A [Phycisphaeraceae bacterium]
MLRRLPILLLAALAVALTACQSAPPYNNPLPAGQFGLRRITDPAKLPDLTGAAAQLSNARFQRALQRSLDWYAMPSSQQHFPSGPIRHRHAWASAYALSELAEADPDAALERLRTEFDVWESVGWDGQGSVFFTGYYTPVFRASRRPTAEYAYPLYKRPDDLVSDPVTGDVRGRKTASGVVPYPARTEIEQRNLLAGQELVYLPSPLDAYLIHVNGSAKLELADGGVMYVGYAGTNGRDYTSIGKLLVERGHLEEHRLSMQAIRDYFRRNPDELDRYIRQNERFVFFREYDGSNWPAGSLGVKVTPGRSLATDKSIFPRACAVLVQTEAPNPAGGTMPLQQLMLDQDTGGAIRAAGRGDIYYGIGDAAGRHAGRQAAEGKMYYLLLKPEHARKWSERLGQEQ